MNSPSNKRVLIVDDTSVMRSLLKQIIKSKGFDVVGEAGDGHQALKLFRELKPRVVCLDIEMPEMNGLDVLARIKEEVPQTGVVMITGDSQASSVKKAITAGANGYIVKPFNGTRVMEAIQKAMEDQ
ncbi:response regulator [Marinospirillum sp.]|uniref:response regulator n=1 Tax=Marinospirillum sp. TaxID=2183934 RepID=UPI0028708817|nr:response regulator [Marinospirillum sp.]MDR9468135.1 response regulator [Marinospirillum sp.]